VTLTRLHHLGLTVTDVEASARWYVSVLGFRREGAYTSEDGSRRKVFLARDSLAVRLGLCQHAASTGERFDETRTGLDHLSFAVETRDELEAWQEACQVLPDVNTLTRKAAAQAYEQAGVGPEDLDLVELHDCFATAELVHYDNLGLCEPGGAVDFFLSGASWRDGTRPVNVSGGLQSKGHPIAATGIANIWEVCHHLRGEAGDRQIEGAKVGLAHVIGLGSACGVHILEKSTA
jgi:acetyl-CoA acetyltransferase